MNRTLLVAAVAATLALGHLHALAQTTVSEAWVRGTVAQQSATGAFMQLRSAKGGKLVGVSSPVADIAELHTMSMEGSTMRMRPVPASSCRRARPWRWHPAAST